MANDDHDRSSTDPGKQNDETAVSGALPKPRTSLGIRPPELSLTRESTRPHQGGGTQESIDEPEQRPDFWTEAMLNALEPHEHDFQEFKGSAWLMRDRHDIQPDFLFYLSKQVSAFVNGSGGLLFIGINDEGLVDGGIRTDMKGGGTRAWLEDLVSACVEPPLPRCNVFEVAPRSDGPSAIHPGHAVYVLELPASQDAPHQSKGSSTCVDHFQIL